MADKLRTTYPLKIKFYEGEQPTALKLSAVSSQAKTGLQIVEKAIGNLWGNGGDDNAKGLQIPTLGRVLGENKYLNPAIYSLHQTNATPFYYIEKLSTKFDGETTGYLTFVPYNHASGPGSGYDIKLGDGSGNDVSTTPDYYEVSTEAGCLDNTGNVSGTTGTRYWIDARWGGSTGKFKPKSRKRGGPKITK